MYVLNKYCEVLIKPSQSLTRKVPNVHLQRHITSYYFYVLRTDMKLNCWPDFVTLVWTESTLQADTSLFRLGNCFPSSVTAGEAVFHVYFSDCNFRMLVSSNITGHCE